MGSCYSIFSFLCMFCRSLFVFFLLVIVPSRLLRFTDSDYLPFVSSNSSCILRNIFKCLTTFLQCCWKRRLYKTYNCCPCPYAWYFGFILLFQNQNMKLCSTEKWYNNWKRGTVIMSGFGFPHHVIVIYICIYILFEPKINFGYW